MKISQVVDQRRKRDRGRCKGETDEWYKSRTVADGDEEDNNMLEVYLRDPEEDFRLAGADIGAGSLSLNVDKELDRRQACRRETHINTDGRTDRQRHTCTELYDMPNIT